MPSDPNSPHFCVICGKRLSLHEAVTDDEGQPVHEDCYVAKLKSEATERSA